LSAAPFSSGVSERGRWNTQILSLASIVMPPTWPMIQLFGSGFGQNGSTLNFGPSASAGRARENSSNASIATGARNNERACVISVPPFPRTFAACIIRRGARI